MARDRSCLYVNMGRVEYGDAFALQKQVAASVEAGIISDTLILLEHPPVLTLGRRANSANVLFSREVLREHGIALVESTRGGDVTYHGPGQIVGYPILNLRRLGLGAAAYVHGLEQVLIDAVRSLGGEAGIDPQHIGVWAGKEKIAAIGVAISGGITMHGFALNVDPDLSHFQFINPCGITDKGVTSLARLLGRRVSMQDVRHRLIESFGNLFDVVMEPRDVRDLVAAGVVRAGDPQTFIEPSREARVARRGA